MNKLVGVLVVESANLPSNRNSEFLLHELLREINPCSKCLRRINEILIKFEIIKNMVGQKIRGISKKKEFFYNKG